MNKRSTKIDERIREIRLFLLDLDGTIYRGEEIVPGAAEFIAHLREKNIKYVFSHQQFFAQRSRIRDETSPVLPFPQRSKNVFTSGQATGIYLSQKNAEAGVCAGHGALSRKN